jgi:hypothetical protein
MIRSLTRRVLVGTAATAAVAGLALAGFTGTSAAAQPAAATPTVSTAAVVPTALTSTGQSDAVKVWHFSTAMKGTNEVRVASGPKKAGDRNGSGTARVSIQGDEVTYFFSWKGISAPTEGHIHQGPIGKDGPVVVPFFMKKVAAGHNTVSGTVRVTNQALLRQIETHPGEFYVNLHTAEFPGGAIRGQL